MIRSCRQTLRCCQLLPQGQDHFFFVQPPALRKAPGLYSRFCILARQIDSSAPGRATCPEARKVKMSPHVIPDFKNNTLRRFAPAGCFHILLNMAINTNRHMHACWCVKTRCETLPAKTEIRALIAVIAGNQYAPFANRTTQKVRRIIFRSSTQLRFRR
jgi:hypothetical protein